MVSELGSKIRFTFCFLLSFYLFFVSVLIPYSLFLCCAPSGKKKKKEEVILKHQVEKKKRGDIEATDTIILSSQSYFILEL